LPPNNFGYSNSFAPSNGYAPQSVFPQGPPPTYQPYQPNFVPPQAPPGSFEAGTGHADKSQDSPKVGLFGGVFKSFMNGAVKQNNTPPAERPWWIPGNAFTNESMVTPWIFSGGIRDQFQTNHRWCAFRLPYPDFGEVTLPNLVSYWLNLIREHPATSHLKVVNPAVRADGCKRSISRTLVAFRNTAIGSINSYCHNLFSLLTSPSLQTGQSVFARCLMRIRDDNLNRQIGIRWTVSRW
jgi:hypothetical protein